MPTVIPKLQAEFDKNKYTDLEKKIRAEIIEKGSIPTIACIYGDMKDCIGFVEEIIRPKEGGFLIKLYGCSFLFKGHSDPELTATLKRALIETIKLFMKIPFVFVIPYFALFRRKATKAIMKWFAYIYAVAINPSGRKNRILDEKEFNIFPREILRVGSVFADRIKDDELKGYVLKFIKFCATVIECDNAYRYRIQDILSNWDKSKNSTKEVGRLFDLMISRETSVPYKMRVFKKATMSVLYMSRGSRKFLSQIINEIDFKKIEMDESDRYFSLLIHGYNTKGWSLEDRIRIKDLIDERLGHVMFSDTILGKK